MSTPKQIKHLTKLQAGIKGDGNIAYQEDEQSEAYAIQIYTHLRPYMQNNLIFPTKTSLGITSFTKGDDEYRFYASVIDFGSVQMINAQCHVRGDVSLKMKGDVIPEGYEPQFSVIGNTGLEYTLVILANGNIQIMNESGNNFILSASWSTYSAGIAPA